MFRLLRLLRTSIGRKLVMALSGLVLVLFVIGHMIGNLKVFQGADALNSYAAWLQGNPLLWGIRGFMLAIIGVHIMVAARLVRGNRAARRQRYTVRTAQRTGIAARSMVISGLLVVAFIVYHLLHLTVGTVQPDVAALTDAAGRPDVYARVVLGFANPWISAIYCAAVLLVGLHLQHAIASLVRTLGFSHQGFNRSLDIGGSVLAVLIISGFLAIPISVQAGLIGMPVSVPADITPSIQTSIETHIETEAAG